MNLSESNCSNLIQETNDDIVDSGYVVKSIYFAFTSWFNRDQEKFDHEDQHDDQNDDNNDDD